ncbi:MAG TPA: Ppx/GppA phosphatase family protein [Candidatus Binataceae bacterium]|nr:Ppx/GppA phosphatase family protein [Candidatus Binataceae bacterium]
MRIAAIDIGSNSIHVVVAELAEDGSFKILDRAKEMVGLARGTLLQGRLSLETIDFGIRTLNTFQRLARRQGADPVLAVATSAVREAANGGDFVLRAWEELGLHIDVITGSQEARLIFGAARHAIDFRGQRPLVVDIGGGSIEIVQGDETRIKWQQSLKLGVVRLSERFIKSDPPKSSEIAALREHARELLAPTFARVRRPRPTLMVGTSGTWLTLTAMASALRRGKVPPQLHNHTLKRQALADLSALLAKQSARERSRMPGLERRRVDTIVAGAIVAGVLMDGFKMKALRVCEWALREGILLDFMAHHQRDLEAAALVPDLRRRSVLEMARRFQVEEAHSRQVARLALILFDLTRGVHGLGAAARELLEYAALLHDVGLYVSHAKHHRHSHYLITQGELRGFEPAEIQLIAAVARFHKGAPPKGSAVELAGLSSEAQKLAIGLAALLRIADGLDRSHHSVVRDLHLARSNGALEVSLDTARRDAELELWAAQRKAEIWDRTFAQPLRFRAASPRTGEH